MNWNKIGSKNKYLKIFIHEKVKPKVKNNEVEIKIKISSELWFIGFFG
jgi:hypothetical protein